MTRNAVPELGGDLFTGEPVRPQVAAHGAAEPIAVLLDQRTINAEFGALRRNGLFGGVEPKNRAGGIDRVGLRQEEHQSGDEKHQRDRGQQPSNQEPQHWTLICLVQT